jgi:hypothetical protein
MMFAWCAVSEQEAEVTKALRDVDTHKMAIQNMTSQEQRAQEKFDHASQALAAQKTVVEGHKDGMQRAEESLRRGKGVLDHAKQSIHPDKMQKKELQRRREAGKVERKGVQTRITDIRSKEMAEAQGGQRRRLEKLSALEAKLADAKAAKEEASKVTLTPHTLTLALTPRHHPRPHPRPHPLPHPQKKGAQQPRRFVRSAGP